MPKPRTGRASGSTRSDGSGRGPALAHRPGAGRAKRRHERVLATIAGLLAASNLTALTPEVLTSTDAVPAHISGRFRDVRGFEQSDFGQFFVFDRRGHRVYGIDERHESAWQIVQLGPEEGRIIEPTAFSLARDGSFVVADMPERQERVQVFTPVGFRIGGFILPQRTRPHLTYRDVVLSGIGSLHYTGSSILISQPESGALVTEYNLRGQIVRTFGDLRATGHEDDREIHLALNVGIPVATPDGGFVFVFRHGLPLLRRFDAGGRLTYERRIEGSQEGGRAAARSADGPYGGRRSSRQRLDFLHGALYLRLRSRRGQDSYGAVSRGRRAVAEQPGVRLERPSARDAGAL